MKLPVILFFIKGPFPSEDQKAAVKAFGKARVVFRNASAVPSEPHALEICDGVAGDVPEIYAKKFPKADVAIAEYEESLKKLSAKVGDVQAPKVSPNPFQAGASPQATGPFGATPSAKPPAWNPNPNPPA